MKVFQRAAEKNTARAPLSPVFRRAAMSDMPSIMKIFEASFESQVPAAEMQNYRRVFPQWFKDARFQFTVAALGKKIIGFTIVDKYFNSAVANLTAIGVDPATQGQGIGRQLMQKAEETAAGLSSPILILEVRENNEKAIRFYTNLGYIVLGTLPQYYSWDHMNALVMGKKIAAAAQDNAQKMPALKLVR